MQTASLLASCAGVALMLNVFAAGAASAQRELASRGTSAPPGQSSGNAAVKFGDSASVGAGRVRSYVTLDPSSGQPIEIGVAFSAAAMDSLPTDGAGHHGQPGRVHQCNLSLPDGIAAPFRFV